MLLLRYSISILCGLNTLPAPASEPANDPWDVSAYILPHAGYDRQLLKSLQIQCNLFMCVPCSAHAQGFEIGSGFQGARMTGSEHNDPFYMEDGKVRTKTNRSGGIQVRQECNQYSCKPAMHWL